MIGNPETNSPSGEVVFHPNTIQRLPECLNSHPNLLCKLYGPQKDANPQDEIGYLYQIEKDE